MSLPKLSVPKFTIKLPSSGTEILIRPFLVKEQKILLVAQEGKDPKEIARATIDLVKQCIVEPTNLDIKSLPIFDIEYIFLHLRAKSVGENIDVMITHNKGQCKHRTKVSINIDDVKVNVPKKHNPVVVLDSDTNLYVSMCWPTYDGVVAISGEDMKQNDKEITMIAHCIENVVANGTEYNSFTIDEMVEWIGDLSQDQFKQLADWVSHSPKLEHTVSWKCNKCEQEDSTTIEGLQSFFT